VKIKILKCDGTNKWYKNHIGEIMDVAFENTSYYFAKGIEFGIDKTDVEVVEDVEKSCGKCRFEIGCGSEWKNRCYKNGFDLWQSKEETFADQFIKNFKQNHDLTPKGCDTCRYTKPCDRCRDSNLTEWIPCDKKQVIVEGVGKDEPIITNDQGGSQSDSPYCWIDLSPLAMLAIAKRSGMGRKKYGAGNWWKIHWQEHLDHGITHIYAWLAGDKTDNHPAAAGWRVIAALGVYLKEIDLKSK